MPKTAVISLEKWQKKVKGFLVKMRLGKMVQKCLERHRFLMFYKFL